MIRFWTFMLQFPCVVFFLFFGPFASPFSYCIWPHCSYPHCLHVCLFDQGVCPHVHLNLCLCLHMTCACVCVPPLSPPLPRSLFLLIVLPLCLCWESGTGACRKSRHLLCKRESKQRDAQTQEELLPSRGPRLGICHSFAFIITQKRERRL